MQNADELVVRGAMEQSMSDYVLYGYTAAAERSRKDTIENIFMLVLLHYCCIHTRGIASERKKRSGDQGGEGKASNEIEQQQLKIVFF